MTAPKATRPAPRVVVPVRLSAEELAAVDRAAKAAGLNRSEWLREAAALVLRGDGEAGLRARVLAALGG